MTGGDVCIGVLAAIGAMSLLWGMLGWLLPVCRQGWILCPGRAGQLGFVPVYLWLRSLGILRCRLVLADLGLTGQERRYLQKRGIEFYSLPELPDRLGTGAEEP